MDGLRQYIISVVSAAMLCGIVTGLMQKGTAREIIRLVSGIFLAFTVIHPIAGIDIASLTDYRFSYADDAAQAAAMGENITRESLREIITTQSEAYILDKAAALNAELTVAVTVSEEDTPVPVEVHLSGEISPFAKQHLQSIIQSDLGIAKENQLWTGQK